MNIMRTMKPINNFTSLANTFRPVTHVIFDMDGLLLDTEGLYKKSFTTVLSRFGKDYSPELRLAVLGTKEDDTSKIIVNRLSLPISPAEFTIKAKEEQSKLMSGASLMAGVDRLVNHLHKHKVPMAVATSSSRDSFEQKTASHKSLFSLFSHVVTGSSDPEVVNGKPAPDIFLLAAKRFSDSPEPSKCLVFEDAPNGVKAASLAGMQVVMVPEDYIPADRTNEATLVLSSLLEFKPDTFGLPPYDS